MKAELKKLRISLEKTIEDSEAIDEYEVGLNDGREQTINEILMKIKVILRRE